MRILFAFSQKPSAVKPFELLIKSLKKIGHDARTYDAGKDLEDLLIFLQQKKWRPDVIHFEGLTEKSFSDPFFARTAILYNLRAKGMVADGVDYETWNPALNQSLARRYSRATLSLKIKNKGPFQREKGLPVDDTVPLIAVVADSGGQNKLMAAVSDVFKNECQFVSLEIAEPNALQRVYAGADMLLISAQSKLVEPAHLIGFKYGTPPIFQKGLSDGLADFDARTGSGNGFLFNMNNSESLVNTVRKAIEAYKNKSVWMMIQERIMEYDFSWNISAKKYLAIYVKALDKIIK